VKFNDSDDEGDDEDDEAEGGVFLNPLLVGKEKKKHKRDDDVSEGEWSSEEDEKDKKNKKNSKKDIKLGKRKKRENDNVEDFFTNKEIEIVPEEKIDEGYSSMDSDDMAETRALAKVMLRKKARNEILDSTYNRYSNFDDKSELPKWFVDEETRHYRPNIPITKEMVAEEKQQLKEYNERPSKKVMEAKHRKKKRLAKAMNKVKQKA
jgi:AdoMet-dependent rRNA methyltransferase SPB1